MSRDNIFGDGKLFKEREEQNRREWQSPQKGIVEIELAERLAEYYVKGKWPGFLFGVYADEFKSATLTLTSIIEAASEKPQVQFLIDTLTVMLKNMPATNGHYLETSYLTAMMQVLFNLGYSNEFTIDTRDWEIGDESIGQYLEGRYDRPLTLEIYGNLYTCGHFAVFSNLVLHGGAEHAGFMSQYSRFTFHELVENCGDGAENCIFELMPGARIQNYLADPLRNRYRRMNEKGDWEEIRWKDVKKRFI